MHLIANKTEFRDIAIGRWQRGAILAIRQSFAFYLSNNSGFVACFKDDFVNFKYVGPMS